MGHVCDALQLGQEPAVDASKLPMKNKSMVVRYLLDDDLNTSATRATEYPISKATAISKSRVSDGNRNLLRRYDNKSRNSMFMQLITDSSRVEVNRLSSLSCRARLMRGLDVISLAMPTLSRDEPPLTSDAEAAPAAAE
jgi:hypothetical protein